MGNKALVYQEKFNQVFHEALMHVKRIDAAFETLANSYPFPISGEDFNKLINSSSDLAFADQIIYRFSKAQDCMGSKLFKSFLLFQGESVDKPFLDILHTLEKLNLVSVNDWFELREIRNQIAHEYEQDENQSRDILNSIYSHKQELSGILDSIGVFVNPKFT